MLIKENDKSPASSEITPENVYKRRQINKVGTGLIAASVAGAGIISTGYAGPQIFAALDGALRKATRKPHKPLQSFEARFGNYQSGNLINGETSTAVEDAQSYNNYYEFGTSKTDPSQNGSRFKSEPWTVKTTGCLKQGNISLDDIIKTGSRQERIYRMRCVEAWSMVIPWIGIPLGDVIRNLEPVSDARYVNFTSVFRPEEMPGQRNGALPWPYTESLRMDEAMHPLTIFALGMYGEILPVQNGAPLRLVVPWKYGFKGIKSIVSIDFSRTPGNSVWNRIAPSEYGFYANVNPDVDHPRWSQKHENRIGTMTRRETLPFNGYAEEVSGLYAGMDLRKNF